MTLIKDTDLQAQIEALRADVAILRNQLATGVGVPDYRGASAGDVLKIVSSYPAWGTPALVSLNVSAPITSTGGTSPTIGHANSGASAGSYTSADITIDAQGHVTAASNGTGGSATWGSITGTLSSQTDLNSALNARGVLASTQTWTGVNTFQNAIGGTYGGQYKITNSSGGATNPNKYFRLSPTGTLEIVNSAHSAVIFQFTDAGGLIVSGSLSLPGTTAQYVRGDGSLATLPGGGTVTSVQASGGSTGLSFSGGPITTSGTLTLSGTLAVANGGTGGTTASAARTNLGAMASAGGTFTGAITAPGVTDSSDARHKTHVRRLADGMKIVRRLIPVHFHNLLTEQDDIGLIAQDVREVLPEVVITDENGDLAVSYQRIVAPLIDAVQMLDARLRALE